MQEDKIVQLTIDYKKTFETEHGARVLADIIARSNILAPTFQGDVNQCLINEGRRELGLMIWNSSERSISELKDMLRIIKQQRNQDEF